MTKDSIFHITGEKKMSDWTNDWKLKLKVAKEKGAAAVFLIERYIPFYVNRYRYRLSGSNFQAEEKDRAAEFVNSCYISTELAKEIIGDKYKKFIKTRDGINKSGKPKSLKLKCKLKLVQKEERTEVPGPNVVGFIEGTDEKLKEEIVIITAHYDHLGKKGNDIYNGADDNASGTSCLIEIAEAFAELKKGGFGPRRSVVVMLVSGEEKGLLGSKYYVSNPVYPLENSVVDINVDMVGRVDKKYKDNPNYIYVIGSDRLSTELHSINEEMNETYTNLTLDYKYNERDDPNQFYYRSDHYNFAKNGIPSIFFFNGTHEDYHRPTDTPEKIMFDKMAKIAQLVFHLGLDIANRDERIVVDVTEE